MADVLVDVLVDRVKHQKRDLRQIVLDESISVIPKLTSSQLDTLTIIFLFKYSVNYGVISFDTLKQYLDVNIKPFTVSLSKEPSLYQHLEFTGCGSISIGSINVEGIFKNTYRGLFYDGFGKDDFEQQIGAMDHFSSLIMQSLNDNTKFQLSVMNEEVLNKKIEALSLDDGISKKLKSLFGQYILSNKEIKGKLIELGGGSIKSLFDVWENSSMKNMSLTSVGIAIAQANYRRKTGLTLDLSIWIK